MILAPARLALIAGCAALALSACGGDGVRITKREGTTEEGTPLRAITALSCPEHHGNLTRVETAPDGLSCLYAGPRGARVTLRLVALAEGQTVNDVLLPFETDLRTLMPETAARASDGEDNAQVSVQTDGENTRVRLPGLSVDQDGERASINIGGIRIRADGASESDTGEIVSVNANENAAEIRTRASGDDLRATYILTDETASDAGWRTVGYEARGPGAGPLVIAVIHSKDREEDPVFEAAKELITLNVGGSL